MANETENCCDIWPKFWPAFSWMNAEIDGERMALMPHHQNANEANKWRVNFCPSCGKDRRDMILKQETLADALF